LTPPKTKFNIEGLTMFKAIRASTMLSALFCGYTATVGAQSEFGSVNDAAAMATTAAGPKTPAIKTVTNFSQALRCMDELFLAYGKQGIVLTSTGIPDETGKVRTGTKEMLITAVAKMTVKSNAFEFIDFHGGGDDLQRLFDAKGDQNRKVPDYYIRGSITQMDDNTVRKSSGFGLAASFFDFGASADVAYDVISMDMSIGDASSRKILPQTSGSNTMVIMKTGKSGEAGGKVGKIGFSFNLDFSRSEGLGATTRALLELGLIETLGKFTQVPYWRCLDADITNPVIREQALETFDTLKESERVTFVQRKLGGSMNRYKGTIDGKMNDVLKDAILEYQAQNSLIADGRVNFDLYAALLDDVQNVLAYAPSTPPAKSAAPRPPSYTPPPAPMPAQAAPAASTANVFRVNLESDKGARPSYKVGEFLNMSLSLSGDGAVHCYYEDTSRQVARIFPNQFFGNPTLRAGSTVRLPSGGFKIRFDQAGKERVACIGADRDVVVPGNLKGAKDLSPLPVSSLDEVVTRFRQANPAAVVSTIDVTVTR
jgi:curli biogenesis system outer membrane secretion channel CsgG/peptidoglycan hydrolase-like protein with peptidoglycan-binding domain